jgi:hypothetical protein
LIFVCAVSVGGHDEVAGVPFCRWLPPLVVSGRGGVLVMIGVSSSPADTAAGS